MTDFMQVDSFWGSCTDLTLSRLEVSVGELFRSGVSGYRSADGFRFRGLFFVDALRCGWSGALPTSILANSVDLWDRCRP